MLVDMKQTVLDYKGKPLLDGEIPVLIGDILLNAANGGGKQDDDAKAKTLRFRLAMRIAAAIEADDTRVSLTADEVVLLRDSTARLYSPLLVGRVVEVLEPDVDESTN